MSPNFALKILTNFGMIPKRHRMSITVPKIDRWPETAATLTLPVTFGNRQ
jgi:hypothetical protein